jgi:hypothetical protein
MTADNAKVVRTMCPMNCHPTRLWLPRSAPASPCVQSRPFFSELSMNQRHPIITTPKARYMRTSTTAAPSNQYDVPART